MTTDPLIGQQLDEYRLEKLLGRGGMARVYEATDVRLNRKVAIKVIDAPYRENQEYGRRFEREARAIAQLEHTHIVRLYRYGEVNDLYYMAMQYVEGDDLFTYMTNEREQGRPLPLEKILDIMSQICKALDYVHSKGVIHRDIKPSNILINKRGQAILTDFGLALLDSTRTRGDVFGSPHYIAPEQAISSAGAVPQSDFYALGAMLYEMVTGEKPFNGDNPLAIAMMHASDPPPPPRQIEPSISPALESVILRSLAKEPANRYANGEAFVTALKQAIQQPDTAPTNGRSGGSSSRPLPPLPAAVATESIIKTAEAPDVSNGRKKSRRRGRRVLLFLLLLLALGTAGVALYQTDANTKTMVDNLLVQNGLMTPPLPTTPPTAAATATTTSTEVAAAVLPTESATSTPTAEPTAAPTDEPTTTPTPTATNPPTAAPTATPTPSAAEPTPTLNPFPPPVTRAADEMPMILIPAGTFMMGAAETDTSAEADEQPAHEVTLDSFYIDQYEVSVGQYVAFLNEEVGFYQYEDACFNLPCLGTQFEGFDSFITDANGQHVGQGDSEDRPVNVIRWQGAAAYCAWVGGRLPTEAEWEYAARGETSNLYPWGDEAPDETRAVFGNIAIGFRYIFEIEAVDALPEGASPFGVYGLAGGVAEWTADAYAADFYASSPAVNPANTSETTAEAYVVRGGAWNSPAEALRTTARTGVAPTSDDKAIGFRCAFDPANAIP